jgi:hypothetical protein
VSIKKTARPREKIVPQVLLPARAVGVHGARRRGARLGDLGHKVICEIAFRLVQPDTRAAITRLMQLDSEFKAFSDSCIYPDHPRIRAAEHFLNLPRDFKGLTSDECPLADACVLTAILYDFKTLQAKEQTDASKLVALKSLGHWVGDIHQPLHVSFLDDKGGTPSEQAGSAWETFTRSGTLASFNMRSVPITTCLALCASWRR